MGEVLGQNIELHEIERGLKYAREGGRWDERDFIGDLSLHEIESRV